MFNVFGENVGSVNGEDRQPRWKMTSVVFIKKNSKESKENGG